MSTSNKKLLSLSRVKPKQDDDTEMDSVKYEQHYNKNRAFHILTEAQHYWMTMSDFRKDRQRNKRYTYGKQWDDTICVDGITMSEEEYIKTQGNVPLKNNLIRRLVRSVLGVYRSQSKEPTCTARDGEEQKLGETMSIVLQCNRQLNRINELDARNLEEFLISGFVINRKSFGWRNGKVDCWTDYVQPNNFIIDNKMRDFRGWDVSFVGEIHDITFGQLVQQFAKSPDDYNRLKNIYEYANDRNYFVSYAEQFGYKNDNYDFFLTNNPGQCRVIEVWRKEQKPRYRCHDYQNGDVFKIDIEDYQKEVLDINSERLKIALEMGIPENDVPLIEATWFIDDYWYFYYLSPFGDILAEGETPYEHGSHPYVFKAYPFIDCEIHSFVADVIDQQRYTNRLIALYDWIMRAAAKGVLMIPEDSLPDSMSMEQIADEWARFDGIILYKPGKHGKVPEQVSANSTNIGISELLNLQLKFFEDISGVNGALQGKPGFSGESAAHFNQQTQNATMSLLDILETFSSFVIDGAHKDVKNIQQFYNSKRIINIAGKSGANIVYDPKKIRDVEFDFSITESTATPAYRMFANDFLMQLYQTQAISVEQLLEFGSFPFAKDLLQNIKSQKEQLAQGQTPDGISPQIMQQAQQGVNMDAVNRLYGAMKSA
ncbi:MAG: hypothetical protein E7067_07160 [Lentimicrobiaceae bacterium]|nr:hypothetical protein [Lentimicrobiaceae bacterium]